jgi:hypothetical protein
MIKTQGKSSITISKLAFLDEMLPEPMLINVADWDEENPRYELENTTTLLELIKKLAAKVLTEDELVNILGNESKFGDRTTYTPNSKEIPH